MLPLLALLIGSAAARAQNEEGVVYTLTTRCVPSDAASTSPASSTYEADASVSVYCSVYSGFRFLQWEDESGEVVSTSRSFTYTMPAKNVTLIARFEYDPTSPTEPSVSEIKKYATVNMDVTPADGGRISSSGDYIDVEGIGRRFVVGTTARLTASANTGFRFVNWTEDGEEISTSSSLRFTVEEGERNLTANFIYDPNNLPEPGEAKFYRMLTLKANPEDAASSFTGAGEHVNGTSFRVNTSANSYYIFENWTDDEGNVVSEEQSFNYTMPNRHTTLTANFRYNFDPTNPGDPGTPSIDDQGIVGKPRMTMQDDTHVMILCSTPGATIHYTLDGTEPTTASSVYTEPVFVAGNIVVKALAVKEGMTASAVTSYQVTSYRAAMPDIAFEYGKIRMICTTEGAEIHYTVDNSDPTADSPVYSAPLDPEEDVLIKAIATKADLTDSDIAVYVFIKEDHIMGAPTFKLHEDLSLEIIPAVEGGETRYTIDGTDPGESSILYTGPVVLGTNCTVRAYTTHIGYYDSPIGEFTVNGFSLPTPTATYGKRSLTLACEDSDADIRYTTDGSAPTSESTLYEAPIPLTGDCTVRFIAMREGFEDSEEISYVFTLADWQEKKPEEFAFDYPNRRMAVLSDDDISFRIVAGDVDRIVAPAEEFDVDPSMASMSVTALATNEDRYDSETNNLELVFHKPLTLTYDGHELTVAPADDDPSPAGIECSLFFDGELVANASRMQVKISRFCDVLAIAKSDNAFASDSVFMSIDAFNTGRLAAARNGHRLSEVFGTWGDAPEDYNYLRVEGEVEKEDLELLGSLPNLTTLHLEPYHTTTEVCDGVLAGSRIETLFAVNIPEGLLKGMPRLTTVMWGLTDERMPAGRLTEAANPNILLWVTDQAMAPADAVNIVTYPYAGGAEDVVAELQDATGVWSYGNADVMEATMALSGSDEAGTVKSSEGNLEMTVIANGASFRNNGDNIQVRTGAEFRIPVISTDDVVTVEGYPGYSYYTISGSEELNNTNTYKARYSDVERGYVAVISTNDNNYFKSFTVAPKGPAVSTDPDGVGVEGTAEKITLQAGYPFGVHMPVDVESIELTKEFSLPTPIGDCGGWESIVLPFDAKSILSEQSGELVPFKTWYEQDDVRPFWLYGATEGGWEAQTAMKAYVPYLISMPNNYEYSDDYIITGKVTFSGSKVKLAPDTSIPKSSTWLDGIEFKGTFMPVEETGIRTLNLKDAAGYDYLGSAFVADGEILPFGAYIKGQGLPERIPVFGDWSGVLTPAAETVGLIVETPAPGTIRVTGSRECRTAIVTPDGAVIRVIDLREGESVTVEGLTRGLYICGGVKVMVR